MNDLEKAEIKQNKAIRGYIIRCLVKGYNKVIEPLPENVRLKHEVIRKPYTSSTKVSETSYGALSKKKTTKCGRIISEKYVKAWGFP